MKLIVKLLTRFFRPYSVKIINQLLRDNDRLNREWQARYDAMVVEKWYWHDLYVDTFYEQDKKIV